MTTPIADFVKKYAQKDISRLHMPAHKGKNFLGCEALDITEINGADVLSSACGIIAQSEDNATSLFGSRHSFYSAEGSSLCIKAMLALVKKKAASGERVKVLASRNAHKSFIYACALLDIDAEWLYPKEFTHLCSCSITPEDLELALSGSKSLPHAVYVTSPDYLGNIADVKGLSDVCHRYGLPLLVDNAHGAYLAFLKDSRHPLALGADMCCDSAHKTLPVLTGGAYLHLADTFDKISTEEVRSAMALFASTSPSYLILQSLDLCNSYLADGYAERLECFITKIRALKQRLSSIGFPTLSGENCEELKLVFSKSGCHYSGNELAERLCAFGIESEFSDEDFLVLMASPENTDRDLERIYDTFCSLEKRTQANNESEPPIPTQPRKVMSIRNAVFADSEIIDVRNALGRICASPTVSCPPAVPITVSGEVIDEAAIKLFLHYGIESVEAVK